MRREDYKHRIKNGSAFFEMCHYLLQFSPKWPFSQLIDWSCDFLSKFDHDYKTYIYMNRFKSKLIQNFEITAKMTQSMPPAYSMYFYREGDLWLFHFSGKIFISK